MLRNLREAVHGARGRLADDLSALGHKAPLAEFMREAGVELEEIYARPRAGHCFVELRRRAGFDRSTRAPASADPLLRTIGRLLHVDDHERLDAWRAILEANRPEPESRLQGRRNRLGLMLFAVLGGRLRPIAEFDRIIATIREFVNLRREINDLLGILADRIRTVARPLDAVGDVPLASHAAYSLGEIAAAHMHTDKRGALVLPQGGVLWDEATQTDLLFVTLEKSDSDFSPTTRYADYPISQTLFHWESQNSASPETPTGRRYIEQTTRGTNVILYLRERKKDGRGVTRPYHCLGRAWYRSHESERPMEPATAAEVEMLARRHGLQTIRIETHADAAGRIGIWWEVVWLRLPDDGTGALPLLRHVVFNDQKSSTYKLALLRTLVRIADGASGFVRPGNDEKCVEIPLGLVALLWIRAFKPLVASNLPQLPRGNDRLRFAKEGFRGLDRRSSNDFRVGLQLTGDDAENMIRAIRDAAHCIRIMPATYTKYPGSNEPVFPCKRGDPVRVSGTVRLDEAFLWSFGTFSKAYQFTGVEEVVIRKEGDALILLPARKTWESYADEAPAVGDDFMAERPELMDGNPIVF